MARIPYKWLVAIVFVLGVFMDIVDTTSINVALPTLADEFDVGVSQVEWVVLGYLLSLAVWIPASGWLGDRFGTKRVFLFSLATFTGASVLCSLSTSLTELVVFRIVQGVGGGMIIPVAAAMLFRAFPPIERAKASAVFLVPMVIGPALGPIFGGWLVTYHSWRWIFYLNVPIGVAAFVLAAVGLREHREPRTGRFDTAGFLLSGTGLAAVLFALSRGPSEGWMSPEVVLSASYAVVALASLVWVETHVDEPMLAFRLFEDRMFRIANVVTVLAFASFAGVLFLLPLYLQDLRGLNAMESGLATFPQAIGLAIASQSGVHLYHRLGPKRMIVGGMTLQALATLLFTTVSFDTSMWLIGFVMLVRGVCTGVSLVALQSSTFANIAPADTGRSTAINSTLRQMSASLGVAIIATVLVEATTHFSAGVTGAAALDQAALDGFRFAFLAATGMIVVAASSALLIRDRDAASTIRRFADAERSAVLSEAT